MPVRIGGAAFSREEVGRNRRNFDGELRLTIRARKRMWKVETPPLLRADADALLAVLDTDPPLNSGGTMIGSSIDCEAFGVEWRHVRAADGERVETAFTLAER